MEFCIITPTAGLERYATLSERHLVLSHLCKQGPEVHYKLFYKARRQAGDFLILDNGAYENGEWVFDPFQAESLTPQVIVLPDYPLQPWQRTWHAAIAFLDYWEDKLTYQPEWLYIPQAEKGDLIGFLKSYHAAIEDPRITWIGIPRALAYAVTPDPLMRVKFAEQVKRDRDDIRLHAFGMVNGDIHELGYLANAGVESIDSSAPVWRGWNGFDIHNRPAWNMNGMPVDFNSPYNPLMESLIRSNLEACNVKTNPDRG